MSLSALIGEPGARRVSPLLFILAILTFFLAFTGVSCNAAATKSAINSIDASQGVSAAEAAQVEACIDALNGVDILTYNGWQLAFGKDPVIGAVPPACNQNNAAGQDTSSANIGPQLLAFLGLVSVGLGLLFTVLGVFGLVAARSRAFVTAVFGAGAGALLLLDQLHVHDVVLSKISSSEGSSVPGLDPASLFSVNAGPGLLIAVVVLGVAVVYNVSALVVRVPVAEGLDPPIPELPEPELPAPDSPTPTPPAPPPPAPDPPP